MVVGFWDLIPLEPGADNSAEQDTATITKENDDWAEEEKAANLNRTLWWAEENWPRLKKALGRQRKPKVDRVWYEGDL